MRTIFLPEVDSTNEWMKRNIDSLQDGDVVYAGIQTQGKGREGKKWHSPPGGLWMSVLLEKEAPYNFIVPVAVCEFLTGEGIPGEVKWPNDILVHDKKICGILIEKKKFYIAGIGLNLNISHLPQELNAVSFLQLTGKKKNPEEVAHFLRDRILYWREREDVKLAYLGFLGTIGRKVKIGDVVGVARGIKENGELVVDVNGREIEFKTGTLRYLDG